MYMSANLSEASAPISAYFGADPFHAGASDDKGRAWEPTPYQTADARHNLRAAAKLVADYHDMGGVRGISIMTEPRA